MRAVPAEVAALPARQRRAIIGIALAACLLRLVFWAYTDRTWEDALITVLHSENFARGLGMTHYHPGFAPLHGFTSPLSVLLPLAADIVHAGWGLPFLKLVSALIAIPTVLLSRVACAGCVVVSAGGVRGAGRDGGGGAGGNAAAAVAPVLVDALRDGDAGGGGMTFRVLQWPRAAGTMRGFRASELRGKVAVTAANMADVDYREVSADSREEFRSACNYLNRRGWLRPPLWDEGFVQRLARLREEPAFGQVAEGSAAGGQVRLAGIAYPADAVIVMAGDTVLGAFFPGPDGRWSGTVATGTAPAALRCCAYDAATGEAHLLPVRY